MAKSKTSEEKIEEMLARLEQRESELEQREAALATRVAGERGGGSFPRPHQAEENVREVVVLARDYLRNHHYQAGSRELQLIEAMAHALYAKAAKAANRG